MVELMRIARTIALAVAVTSIGTDAMAAPAIEIRNVRIIDVRDGSTTPPRTVRIENGLIRGIEPTTRDSDRAANYVDGTSKYLVPGYWDMHAHVSSTELAASWIFPLFVASGVTGVRDTAGDCWVPDCKENIDSLRSAAARIESGEMLGPRIVAIGSDTVGGPRAAYEGLPEWASLLSSEQGRELARIVKGRGVDFVKPYDTIPRDAYFGMMAEARQVGIGVAGHVPKSVSMLEAVEAGQLSVEHAKHPAIDCSTFAPVFRGVFARWAAGESEWIYNGWADDNQSEHNLGGYYQHVLASFDEDICKEIISKFAASDAFYVPTLITRKFEALADDPAFLDDARLRFVPRRLHRSWKRDADNYEERFSNPVEKRAYVEFYELGVRLVGDIHRAGVPVLVGTDAPDSYCFPGSGYHDELQELKSAGLSNADILRAATYEAARVMNLEGSYGTIEVGKVADLLILNANPLSDIANAARISTVILNGRLLDRAALDALAEHAYAFAASQ